MGLRRRGPANQQRNGKALAFHLFRHVNHLVQRRGNQPGEANQVGIHFAGGFEDFIRRHHHAKIDNFVVIALQHHANDIFTDVVDVAFHGRNDHLAVAGALFLAGFNIRFQIGDRLFHHAGRLYHLRQEHFAFAEQIADHVHAVHQRAFNHFYRTSGLLARLFGIQLDKLGNAFYQRVFKPFFHVPATPFRLLGVGGVVRFATAVFFRQLQQTLGAVSMTVEDHVFNGIAQFHRQIVINRQLAGVNDPHIHAVTDGVVQEDGVNRFANRIVAAEREGDVRDAAGNQRVRQLAFNVFTGADKVLRIVVVLFNAGGDGEDIGVKNNIFRREAHLFGQNLVRPAANFDFPRAGIGLANFIEGHHHHGSAVATHLLRMLNEGLYALFHRDGVDDTFALNTFQTLFDDLPFRGVDHNRYPGDIRLAGDQIKETHHRRFGVEHPLIHVDIDNLRAAFHLLTGNVQRFVIFFFFNQALEFS